MSMLLQSTTKRCTLKRVNDGRVKGNFGVQSCLCIYT